MQISRHLLLACVVATYLTPAALRAYDNEAQSRARQALEEKMNQLDAQTAPTNSPAPAAAQPDNKTEAPAQQAAPLTPVPAVTTSPENAQKLQDALDAKMQQETQPAQAAPAAASATNSQPAPAPKTKKRARRHAAPTAPVETKAAPENPPAQPAPGVAQPATPMPAPAATADTATSDRLQQALDEKMQSMKHNKPATAPAAPAAPATPAYAPLNTPTPAPTVAAPAEQAPAEQAQQAPAKANNFAPIAPSTENSNGQELQQALQQRMHQAPAPQAPARGSAAPGKPSYAPVPTGQNHPSPSLPPMAAPGNMGPQQVGNLPALQGPPTGLSPDKQRQLDEILQLYKADQLTPEQYHEKRAKILEEK